ncbi:hypothetical protein F5883DRAFT_586160 [Diaporthe sp. PMI_573]|nr:hypothetical protein F5883DRAFT_586160 [Diaporthaceae sp. PMI_573]
MEGYAKVSKLMATYDQLAILRGFKSLSYQNLLYRQAEIIHLKEDLDKLIQRDAVHPDRQMYSKDWWRLAHTCDKEEDQEQWKLWQNLSKKLDEYNDRLLKQAKLSKLDPPTQSNLAFLREWLERPTMGCFPIRGLDMDAWDVKEDLVALKSPGPRDLTTRWVTNTLIPFYHRLLGEKLKDPECPDLGDGNIYNYKDTMLASAVDILTTVIASLLPLLSILILFLVHSDAIKLGVIVASSAMFSFALALMTQARRIEVFAATAAYAAVNVVFITAGPTA